MVRRCDDRDSELNWSIINDGARAYKGTIPADRWMEPYMSRQELRRQIDEGVLGLRGVRDTGGRNEHSRGSGCDTHPTRLCSHEQPEARNRSAIVVSLARINECPDTDRNLDRCGLGDPVLRKVRLSTSWAAGEGPPAQEILDHPRTPN